MKIQIKANARPTNEGFVGYVVVKRGLDYLWSESTPKTVCLRKNMSQLWQ